MNLRRLFIMAAFPLFISSVSAKDHTLVDNIFLNLPQSVLDMTKAEKDKMLKGGDNPPMDYEPTDTETYPNGILIRTDSYAYQRGDGDNIWELKVFDTANADEKLVIIQEGFHISNNKITVLKYAVKSQSFTKQEVQLPIPELSELATGFSAKEKKLFDANKTSYGNNFVVKNFDVADGAVWQSINGFFFELDEMANSSMKSHYCYFYWDGTKFVKAEQKKVDVTAIRDNYSDVKKNMGAYKKTVKQTKEMVAAIGEQTRTYTLFEKEGRCIFATQQFNVAARNYYDEYLFDANGQLIFCFRKYPDYDNSQYELRFYFKNGLLAKSLVKVKKEGESAFKTIHEGASIPNNDIMFEYKNVLIESHAANKFVKTK